MTLGAILTTIIMALIFIGVLWFCFAQIGKGGKWED